MPETIVKSDHQQIIGGAFSNRKNADNAIQELRELGVLEQDIQVVVSVSGKQAEEVYDEALTARGVAESQASFYDNAVRNGKTLVVVHNVTNPAEVIEILDRNGAEYNPDGSRNFRDDVFGMTAGAAAGAVAGGVAGTLAAGPLGGAIGAAAGAVVGGGAGAAGGKAAEHSK